MRILRFIIGAFMLLSLGACYTDRDDYLYVPDEIEGYRPLYFDTSQDIRSLIFSTSPRAVKNPGKIYVYKNYLFVGEPALGVHVFDNTDPALPIPFAFINIPYNYDIAVKDTVLFADTYVGLVTIGISKLPAITVLQYIKSTSLTPSLPLSQFNRSIMGINRRVSDKTYFECIDNKRGVIVGWEKVKLVHPKCYQ